MDQPPALFRTEFRGRWRHRLGAAVRHRARAVRGGDQRRTGRRRRPGARAGRSYRHRLRYHTYDVTDLLRAGDNAIGVTVADGWFRGHVGFDGGHRNLYGERLGLLAQLEIRYADGTVDTVVTDEGWRAGHGPIRRSGIYAGETYDARLEPDRVERAGIRRREWSGVRAIAAPTEQLVAPTGPPVRRDRGDPAGPDLHLAAGPDDRGLRAEPGRVGADHGVRAGRRDRHAAARRGARRRGAGHPPAAAGGGHRPVHPARRRGRRPGSRGSPSTASAMSRSTAGPVICTRMTCGRWSCTPTWPGPAGSPARTSC